MTDRWGTKTYSALVTDIVCTAWPDHAQVNILTDGYFRDMSGIIVAPLRLGRATDILVTWLGDSVATADPEVCKIDILKLEQPVPEDLVMQLRVDCPSTLTFERWDGGGEVTGTAIPSSYTLEVVCGVLWPEEGIGAAGP